ncbi:hypothetical protein AYI68_g5735 [Smittium mucronatum]|uniref:Uncharacterized protein n=1 Tax=Smittium mucronatum TaxID=133383 RepID=A0A1R0GTF7_9FUNG|nr:hypothetical protein AYI68_g5735 [Smittium mucronatum]
MYILGYKQRQKYLTFNYNGRFFQFRVLSFGLSLSQLGDVYQGQGSPKRGKQITERWRDDIEMSGELYWETPIDVYIPSIRKSYALPAPGAQ